MKRHLYVCLFAAALTSCGPRRQPQEQTMNAAAPVLPATTPPATVANKEAPPAQPTAKRAAVDPKSGDAATELVQSFVGLLNRRKFDEAYMLLGPNAQPRSEFDRSWAQTANLHVTVGKPGDQEGAAGSIYLSVPLTVSGTEGGRHVSRSATAILRRVNDVPGSTEAQRHWYIERIDWGSGA
jgi:hypothetical protein